MLARCGCKWLAHLTHRMWWYRDGFVQREDCCNLAETGALEARMRKIMTDIRSLEVVRIVWTQLTDVQQEINGFLYFDRQPKLPIAVLNDIFNEGGEV